MADNTRFQELMEEQIRLARKADRRSGCLWNIVMTVLLGWLYLAWLLIKRLAKWVWWIVRMIGRSVRWVWRQSVRGTRWVIHRIGRR